LYGEGTLRETGTLDEASVIAPRSTYGAAKAAIDYYCQTAWRERGVPVIALRQFNCIGERETHPYVVPEIISQLDIQRKFNVLKQNAQYENAVGQECYDIPETGIVKLGNNSTRDFMYAGDAVLMANALLMRGKFGEVYNLGSESSIAIYDLAKLIGRFMGFNDVRVEVDEARKRHWEIWHLQSDNSKIRAAIGEMLTTPLEEALRRTIAYYESNGRKWDF